MRSISKTLVFLLVALGLSAGVRAEEKPIVAVFDLEDRGSGLDAETISRLTKYLEVLLTEGGYQIIPREQIRERLASQKEASFKSCYDQTCQIELGRELAAQFSLSSQILKIGDTCRLAATLYDLKLSATSKAASAKSPCTENDLGNALEAVAFDLTGGKAGSQPAAAPAPVEETAPVPEQKEDQPEASAESTFFPSKPREHDGFFVRLNVGVAYGGNSTKDVTRPAVDEVRVQGVGSSWSISVGYAFSNNFAVHLDSFGGTLIDPAVYDDDTKVRDVPGKYTLAGVGAGMTYYFMPINIFLSASVGVTILKAEINILRFESEPGVGASALVGKEWWLSDNWALGVAGQFIFSLIPDFQGEANRSFAGGLMLSITYN
jgi:hypothetical protein